MNISKVLLTFSIFITIVLIFSSCTNSNLATDETEIVSHVPYTIVPPRSQTTTFLTDAGESKNQYGYLYNYGYLYDFDLDGIDEVILFNFDQVSEIIIYKKKYNEYVIWGDSILFNSIHPEWFTIDNLTLYYDTSDDNYFYINEYDVWEKYFNYADINKYLITENGLVKSNIAHCEFLYDEEIDFSVNTLLENKNSPIGSVSYNDMSHYHNNVDEYLNQFEKIRVITRDQLTSRPLLEDDLE